MGTYFNPSNKGFEKSVNEYIYIDKTNLIECTNQFINREKNCIALSHARRFGKSQAARMLEAYYSRGCDSRELFSKYKIAKCDSFEKHLNKYDVIHIDVSSFLDDFKENIVEKIKNYIIDELQKEYPNIDYSKTIQNILASIYDYSHIPFVIIIDEWDCIIRNCSDNKDIVHNYLQFLHALFKSAESVKFLALGYITGILPIKKIEDESALNNFNEYTMIKSGKFKEYFGFTEKEVKMLCDRYNMSFETTKKWYDGYTINGTHIYNPNSVCSAMLEEEFDTYWKNTSAFETVNKFITLDFEGLKQDVMRMLAGEKILVDVNTFKNDFSIIGSKDDALTALIHLGYLAYDERRKQAYIPNYEVSLAFNAAIKSGNWTDVANIIAKCDELLYATIDKNEKKVAQLLESIHDAYSSIIKYNNEHTLSCIVTLAYFTAPAYYTVVREFPSGKGFADIAFIPRTRSEEYPAMIVELKWNATANSAIQQIKDRKYTGKLKGYGDEIYLVGITYDNKSKNKEHRCKIETIRGL